MKEFFHFLILFAFHAGLDLYSVERNVNESVANPQLDLLLGVKPFHALATTAIFGRKDSITMLTPPFGATIPICDVNIGRHQSECERALKQNATPCSDAF